MNQDNKTAAGDAFERAKAAAAAGDPAAMLVALYETFLFDGMVYRLKRSFPKLPEHEAREVVARVVLKTYNAVRQGRRVSSLGAYLFKAFRNETYDLHSAHYAGRSVMDVSDLGDVTELPPEEDRTAARTLALGVARRLLPQLGQHSVLDVMAYIFEAIEQGIEDLPDAAIAEALGLQAESVKVLRNRGFQRLARLAAQEGLKIPNFNNADDEAEGNQIDA